MSLLRISNYVSLQLSESYVPTHYVDLYSNIIGATSDEDAQNAAAFANATSSSTACTLACAVANMSAGHYVQCAPGAYLIADTPDGSPPALRFTNTGQAGNPMALFAQYPAAYNRTNPSLWSEIRRPVTVSTDNNRPVVLAVAPSETTPTDDDPTTSPGQYVTLDGFYIDESITRSGPSRGVINLDNCNGINVRRFYLDRRGVTQYPNGGQGHFFWGKNTSNSVFTDLYAIGDWTEARHTAIELYNAKNVTVEHVYCEGIADFIYWKTEDPTSRGGMLRTTGNIQRYCHQKGMRNGLWVQSYREVDFYNNIVEHYITDNAAEAATQWQNLAANVPADVISTFKYYNNTFYVYLANAIGPATAFYVRPQAGQAQNGQYYNNIVYIHGGTGVARFIQTDVGLPAFDTLFERYNNNVYFADPGSSIRWQTATATYTSLSAWQTSLVSLGLDIDGANYDANSINEDPQFVDAANGNFRLASNGQNALTASLTGGPVGAYVTGAEEIGLRSTPTY